MIKLRTAYDNRTGYKVMQKKDVIEFFDMCALEWDADMIRNDEIINTILDNTKVCEGKDILDVACGTGVLIPDYLTRKVKSVTAIDISSEMIKIAQGKFRQENVRFICDDVEVMEFDQKFDCIVVYNAFPHFPNPKNLVKVLASHLKPEGVLSIAHGMSRAQIDRHHSGKASKVSNGLMSEDELAEIFEEYLDVTVKISDNKMYQVVGSKIGR